jgi:hypothetical protein
MVVEEWGQGETRGRKFHWEITTLSVDDSLTGAMVVKTERKKI